jgi:hypothetical protein
MVSVIYKYDILGVTMRKKWEKNSILLKERYLANQHLIVKNDKTGTKLIFPNVLTSTHKTQGR